MSLDNLNVSDFTENKSVLLMVQEVQDYIATQKAADPEFGYSDAVDEAGNWYVDLVQEGGGVLGVALLGYTYILEKAGVRFLKLAGTSAGAINTVMMSAADKSENERSPKVLEHLAKLDLFSFVDGDDDVKDFVESLNEGAGTAKLLFKGMQIFDNLKEDMGLNPGKQFQEWMTNTLAEFGIENAQQLREQMEDLPDSLQELIYPADKAEERKNDWPFAVVAADITTESKAVFPKHAGLYFEDPEKVNPAYFVRASMSVPIFFHPLRREPNSLDDAFAWEKEGIPQSPENKLAWERELEYMGPHPEKVLFVDGGILSNFPIDIFHAWDKIPRRPTFGVKLGLSRNTMNEVEDMNYAGLIAASFNAARMMRDQDFILNNPEYRKLVAQIDIGEHNWLDFALSDEAKIDLFIRGAQTGLDFLKGFNWKEYKGIRQKQLLSMANKVTENIFGVDLDETLAFIKARRSEEANKMLGTKVSTRGMASAPSRSEVVSVAAVGSSGALGERMKLLGVLETSYKALWIDDAYAANTDYPKREEVKLCEAIGGGGEIHFVNSNEEAFHAVAKDPDYYDLIISDIKRANGEISGTEFLKGMVNQLGFEKVPPMIFYITDFDPARGTPAYAFGITNSPSELIHLVADVLQRK
ncbi:MAG: patatin-like phospholipase family protein [Bacteroidia bacterium]